jgi:hypothetical protein
LADLSGFAVMRDALRATGRPIFYSINPGEPSVGCVPGTCAIDLPSIANMWRIGSDINAFWSSVVGLTDTTKWTNMIHTGRGAKQLAYDSAHHIVYAANWGNGLWRLVTR